MEVTLTTQPDGTCLLTFGIDSASIQACDLETLPDGRIVARVGCVEIELTKDQAMVVCRATAEHWRRQRLLATEHVIVIAVLLAERLERMARFRRFQGDPKGYLPDREATEEVFRRVENDAHFTPTLDEWRAAWIEMGRTVDSLPPIPEECVGKERSCSND